MMTQKRSNEEIIALLEQVLANLRERRPRSTRAVQHVESAIKCLRDPREAIHPADLNSANDG